MDEQINVMYDRVTASRIISKRPVLLDAVIAANRHFLVALTTGMHNGSSTYDPLLVVTSSPVYRTVVIVLEHPAALDRGLFASLSLAGSVEATLGYRIW